MRKVLFVTTRLIYPVNDGRKVVLYNYCKGMAEQYNCEVRLFSLIEDEENKIKQPGFIKKVYYGNLPSKFEKAKNLIFKSILLNKWPLQISLYYSKKAKQQLDRVIDEYSPDIVICDMARTAEYLKDLDGLRYNKILDMDDILSKRYKRQVKNGTLGVSAIGAYSKKIPNFINTIINNDNIMRFILNKEASLLSKYEVTISKYYKSIVFVSPIEAKEFNDIIGEDKCIDITIGVDYDYFSESVIEKKKEKHIVFLGNMYVAHNKDAVNSFIKNIFPLILKEIPDAKFRIVGRCPKEYKECMEQNLNIEVTGEVDDIRKYVQECTVAVAPLTYGSGIKTKILETMAMGVPVVTNDIGIEGIDVKHNEQIIVANNPKVFSGETISLLINKDKNADISVSARCIVFEKYTWENTLKNITKII
ncbi:MAG: glycosyltransferase [Clostridium lundense]|nr:glycosyltransferase [Clostridium lundense]